MFSDLYPISPYNSTMIIANSVPFPTNISSVYNENCSIFIREIYYSLQFKTTEKNEVTILMFEKMIIYLLLLISPEKYLERKQKRYQRPFSF